MTPSPDTTATDLRHLRLLSIFHFVFAGLSAFGLLFLAGHYLLMQAVMNDPGFAAQPQAADPAQVFAVFRWIYVVAGLLIVVVAVANLLSGLYLRRRTKRMFSFVLAALNCLSFPFGTVLGVFTILVLSRESVRALYSHDRGTPTAL